MDAVHSRQAVRGELVSVKSGLWTGLDWTLDWTGPDWSMD